MRSQDVSTPGDPTTFNGTVIRIDPDTGAAAPGNPLSGGAVLDDDPIIGYGLRNPFRMSVDAVTGRLWIADVGWDTWEELNTIPSPLDPVRNFGWPCYEGVPRQPGYEAANLPVCQSLYSAASAQSPYYSYQHAGGFAVTGVALYRGQSFPSNYDGALFFSDYAQGWIKVMMAGANGLPDPSTVSNFVPAGAAAVDLQVGPNGELFYVDIVAGTVRMIKYFSLNGPPAAVLSTDVTAGPLPLTVHFDGSASTDPEGQVLTFAWDLNGDGNFSDAVGSQVTYTYTAQGPVTARMRVSDPGGATDTATVLLAPGVSPPQVAITSPTPALRYEVGDSIPFSGTALDPDTGQPLPVTALTWQVLLNHCAVSNPTDCHEHFVRSFTGVSSGSFIAPDHEYPAFLRLVLTATKPVNGAATPISSSASQVVLPAITTLTFASNPSGLQLFVYGAVGTTPFSRTMIEGAQTTVSAASPQLLQGAPYAFAGWSDGGAQTHSITAPAAPATLTATFTPVASVPVVWNSWEVATQGGTPQGLVSAVGGGTAAAVEFYESTDDGGVAKGTLFGAYSATAHPEGFNGVEGYWRPGTGEAYPYAGKSTVGRGADVGETNVVGPTGVRDLQLHPPDNLHNTVAAFRAPLAGTYTISGVGVRRVSNLGGPVRLQVLDAQTSVLANIQATTTRAWTWAGTTYTVPGVAAGAYLYFAVDGDGDFDYDATEIAWTITAAAGPAAPSCTLSAVPSTISQGGMTTLSWTSANATSLSIDQGVGLVAPAGGSVAVFPATSRTYTATATGSGGTATCAATVTVTAPPPPPTCALGATPASIPAGSAATLSWTTSNATSLVVDQGVGSVTPVAAGTRSVTPGTTTTYTATATGGGGTATCSVTVTVTGSVPVVWNSWEVATQGGTPQGLVSAVGGRDGRGGRVLRVDGRRRGRERYAIRCVFGDRASRGLQRRGGLLAAWDRRGLPLCGQEYRRTGGGRWRNECGGPDGRAGPSASPT